MTKADFTGAQSTMLVTSYLLAAVHEHGLYRLQDGRLVEI